MKIRHHILQLLVLALFVLLASACIPATPIVVIVTPTLRPSSTPTPALDGTATAVSIASTATANASKPSGPTLTPSITPTGPTATFGAVTGPNVTTAAPPSLASGISPTPGPTATGPTPVFGAIVGPNVTPYVPPSLTPGPSPTPLPQLTASAPTVPTIPGVPAATFGAVIGPNTTPYVPPTVTPGPPPTLPSANVTLMPLVTPGPSPTPGPILRSALMGIQIHGYLTDAQWSQMLANSKDLGMGWIKVQVQWAELEPARGVFNELYSAMVLNIQRARIQGLHTMVSFAKAPGWARAPEFQSQEDGPPVNPQDLADFVARFVQDCKPEFLDAIEIWNEPNLIREWRGRPLNGGEYMRYFTAAYNAIQNAQKAQASADHRIAVITAGLAPTSTSPDGTSVNDRDFLQQMYNAGLARIGSDIAIGAHPYGWANPPDATCCTAQAGITGWFEYRAFYFRDTLDDYHKIMLRNNHTAGKVWVTEFGWATYDGLRRSDGNPASADPRVGWEKLISQGQQGSYILRAFYMAQQPPYYDYLGPMMLWNLNFATIPKMTDDSREEAGFSLLNSDTQPRPAYQTLKNAPKQ